MSYTPHTPDDIAAMLAAVGADSLTQLVHVPAEIALRTPVEMVPASSEIEIDERFRGFAAQTSGTTYRSFLGAGAYRHYVPPVIASLAMRGEFLTAYTPYQAEVSQGYLQAIYEWQSYVALLTGLDVANASVYDGATALAEGAIMAINATGRSALLVASTVHPNYRAVLRTYAAGLDVAIDELPYTAAGTTDPAALIAALAERPYAAVVIQSPNFFGALDPLAPEGAAAIRAAGALTIAVTAEALALAVLRPPGAWGADIAVGEAQSFGNPVAFGGPNVGFVAATSAQLRRIPGRLVGRTVDVHGETAYVLTLQAREQHIRREKATSNICTNQAHCALVATIYLAALGRTGLRDVAAHNLARTAELRAAVTALPGCTARFDGPTFNEFVLRVPGRAADVLAILLEEERIIGGLDLGRFYPELADCILMNATELTTSDDITRLRVALREIERMPLPAFDTPLIFEQGAPGRANRYVPAGPALADYLPPEQVRDELPLPDNSELDVVRHFTRLSQKTYGIDTVFYPLGSCTMKYNPRINDALANLPALRDLHPFVPDALAQGALAIMWELERSLSALFGMAAFSLEPAAGAHAELGALLIAKAYFRKRGEHARTTVLVPDTAHGTNPASAAMVGYRVVSLPSDARGRIAPETVAAAVGADTAVCMMTNPNTLGLFEDQVQAIAATVHAAGGLMYYDGANANALMGASRPGDMGFDLMHLNLHKTFSIPHGGGGAGAGPLGVAAPLVPFLPLPLVRAAGVSETDGDWRSDGRSFWLDFERPDSIGPVRSFWSNFQHMVRALAYCYANGPAGLARVAQLAVLNANYVRVGIRDVLDTPYDEPCRHEFVASAQRLKRETGVRALDLAKALLDRGYHAPTIYFPLIVPECLMIEPTETESKETLDGFIGALREIVALARRDPAAVQAAPTETAVGRVDEARAARDPDLRWRPQPG